MNQTRKELLRNLQENGRTMRSEESRTFWEDIWGKNININTLDGCCMQLEADLVNLDKQIDVQVTKNAKLKITSTR